MHVTAKVEKQFDVAAITVSAEVRYWEDATVNGEKDSDGSRIPLVNGTFWEPTIEFDTGRVRDWPEGTEADIHYKVCDAGFYELLDAEGNVVATKDGYVHDMLAVDDDGYGDYIILSIGKDGLVKKWKQPEVDPDDWAWITKE